MRLLNEFDKYLIEKGYERGNGDFINTVLDRIYYKDGVTLYTEGTPEFWKELELKGELDFSMSDYEVTKIFIESPIVNRSDFETGEKKGITLVQTPDSYYKHDFSLLDYCLNLNLIEHEKKILRCHQKNLEFIQKYQKFLEEHDYKLKYSSLFDIQPDIYYRDSSDFSLRFTHYFGGSIFFETDCLTGELKINDKLIDKDKIDLEKYLEKEFWLNSDGTPKPEFKYFYDHNETKETYKQRIYEFNEREIIRDEF